MYAIACDQQSDIQPSKQAVLGIVNAVGGLIFIDLSDLQHLKPALSLYNFLSNTTHIFLITIPGKVGWDLKTSLKADRFEKQRKPESLKES